MRILVTGSTGYIGALVVPMLKADGHDVVGLDCDLFEQCTFGEWADAPAFVRKDVRDVAPADLEGCGAIVHLAGLSDDSLGALVPQLTYDINHAATVRLARRPICSSTTTGSAPVSAASWAASAVPGPLTARRPATSASDLICRSG